MHVRLPVPVLRRAGARANPSYALRSLSLSRPALSNKPKDDELLKKLYASFSDPSSPFYLAPGTVGPADPGDAPPAPSSTHVGSGSKVAEPNAHRDAERDTERVLRHAGDVSVPLGAGEPARTPAEGARVYALKEGYDASSFWDETVAWGDLDSFRHLNNVRYVRFFESGRMKLTQMLGEELGGPKMAKDMMEGRGVSIILKSIDVRFRRPVTYPDSLLIAHKPHSLHPTQFTLSCLAYSYAQQAPVATAEAVCVWYDYDVWKKCEPSKELAEALAKRAR